MSIFAKIERLEKNPEISPKRNFSQNPAIFWFFKKITDFLWTNQNGVTIGTYTSRRKARPARICSQQSQLFNAEKTNVVRLVSVQVLTKTNNAFLENKISFCNFFLSHKKIKQCSKFRAIIIFDLRYDKRCPRGYR